MPDITIEELEKAARNIERVSGFIGERRDWLVGEGGESAAVAVRDAATDLSEKLTEITGCAPDPEAELNQPAKLEPPSKISAARLSKFAAFLRQLQNWFSSQDDVSPPEDADEVVQSIHHTLALVSEAVESLLKPPIEPEPPPPAVEEPPTAEELVGEIDSSPVAEVDTSARLVLEETPLKPLLQTFQGVTELTVEAKRDFDDFIEKQGIEIEGYELRRLHDKLLKWIEGIPLGQVLVIKISGLSGKPQPFSSYQPKGGVPETEEEAD